MEKTVLKLDNVSKSFAKIETDDVTHALSSVTTTMESGEFISMVGPSGCGKSTILRLVAGLIQPTTGTITLNGKPNAIICSTTKGQGVPFMMERPCAWHIGGFDDAKLQEALKDIKAYTAEKLAEV